MPDPEATPSPETSAAAPPAETTPTGAPAGTPKIDIAAVLAENKRLSDERAKLLEANAATRQQRDRFASQAREAQRRLEESGSVGIETTPAPTNGNLDRRMEGRLAEIGFKMDHPDWNKPIDKSGKTVWDAMTAILWDDTKINEFLGITPDHTLNNIYREIRYQQATEALKSQVRPSTVRAQIAAQADLSGQGANTPVPTINLDDPAMTDAVLLDEADKAGWLDGLVDPNDPPSSMRR
jgi:Holliday junction resolvase RusA-like endonuclease